MDKTLPVISAHTFKYKDIYYFCRIVDMGEYASIQVCTDDGVFKEIATLQNIIASHGTN